MAAQPYPKTFVIPNRLSGEESAGPMRTAGSSLFRCARRLGMTDFGVSLETNTLARQGGDFDRLIDGAVADQFMAFVKKTLEGLGEDVG
jgi:hypothetical protein